MWRNLWGVFTWPSYEKNGKNLPLFVSEISVLVVMVRYRKAKFIGCCQTICGLFCFCFCLPRNNISFQFISVICILRVEGRNIKVDTFVVPLDQGSSWKQIALQTWNHPSLSSWLPLIFLLIDTRSVLSFPCFVKYFWMFFRHF